MSFATIESSRTLGEPIALFLFTYGPGAGDVYGYTSAEQQITWNNGDGVHGAVTYLPVPINRDTIVATGSLDKSALKIRLTKSLDIGQLFTGFPPSQIVTLQIYQGHAQSTDFKPLWFGRLLSHEVDDDDILFTCEPISSALRRSGLRRNYQRSCPHALYGPQCKVNRASFTHTAVASTVVSPNLTLPSTWHGSLAASHFLNGPIWWTNAGGRIEYRSILQIVSPTILLLDGPCPTLTAGMTVSFAPGCNHQLDDCSIVFSNPNNYGGMPWIPLKNPFGIVSNFI